MSLFKIFVRNDRRTRECYIRVSVVRFVGGRGMARCAEDLGSTPAYIYIFLCLSKP